MLRQTICTNLCLAAIGICVTGCSSGPKALVPPDVDPSDASAAAMDQLDANGDGSIGGDELAKSPALKTALKRVDSNGDGAISPEEIEARVQAWHDSKVGLFPARVAVTLNGDPLEGAEVHFEPEPFLGQAVITAVGVTNAYGEAVPAIPKELRSHESMPDGTQCGFYTVRISKVVNGKETLPARYNTQSQIGEEISMETPGLQTGFIRFALKSP